MEHEALAERFKLDITFVSNNRCREVTFRPSPDPHGKQERSVVMWSRKHDLANNVYVHESSCGELRVVKRVALRERASNRFELAVIGTITKATEYVRSIGCHDIRLP